MFCPKCGTKNLDSARFCKSCGASLFQAENKISQNELQSTTLGGTKKWNKKILIFGLGTILVVGIVFLGVFIKKKQNTDPSGNQSATMGSLTNQNQPQKTVTFKTRTVSQKLKNSYGVTTNIDLELPQLEGTYDGIATINAYYDELEKELVFMYEIDEVNKNFWVKASFRKEAVMNDIISISGNGHRGVTGSVKIYGDVFDLNTGKKLTLEDVFNVISDKYLALIYKNVSNSIKEEMTKELEETEDTRYDYNLKDINSVSTKKAISAFDPKDFFLKDKSLVVFYPQGSFGCNGCGEFKYEIPFDSIKDVLKINSTTDQPPDHVNKDLHTYTNDIYKYKFSYPTGTVIEEAQIDDFPFEGELTPDDNFKKYTGKICLNVNYKDGSVFISAPANEDHQFMFCTGRTGIGSESSAVSAKENISIGGKTYTADTMDVTDGNEHNYLVYIELEDRTRINISTSSLETKAILEKVVESYTSTKPDTTLSGGNPKDYNYSGCPDPKVASCTIIYIDPGSGETVITNPNQTPEKADYSGDGIIMLGFSKLIDDYGMTFEQVEKLQSEFEDYSSSLETPLKEISVTLKSVETTVDSESGNSMNKFTVTLGRSKTITATVKSFGISDPTLELHNTDGTQVYSSK